jgi:hypothetical protein
LAGWALYVREKRAVYVNNRLQLSTFVTTTGELPIGREVVVGYEWQPSAVGVGTMRLLVDGVVVSETAGVETTPRGYSMVQEGLQIGRSWGPSVSSDHYDGTFAFTGSLRHVELRTDPSGQLS